MEGQKSMIHERLTDLRALMEEKGIKPEDLTYERRGSYIFTGEVR